MVCESLPNMREDILERSPHPHNLFPPALLCYIINACQTARLGQFLANLTLSNTEFYAIWLPQFSGIASNWITCEHCIIELLWKSFIQTVTPTRVQFQSVIVVTIKKIVKIVLWTLSNTDSHLIFYSRSCCTLYYVHKEAALLVKSNGITTRRAHFLYSWSFLWYHLIYWQLCHDFGEMLRLWGWQSIFPFLELKHIQLAQGQKQRFLFSSPSSSSSNKIIK